MSSPFYLYILALLSLFFFAINAEATSGDHKHSDFRPKKRGQRFTSAFNLFPRLDANVVKLEDDPLVNASTIIENVVRFPLFMSDSGTANVKDFGRHAGYVSLNHTKAAPARMFYFFFEARVNKTKAPVVVWLSGGPGCSSSLALFYENGPFHIANDLSLVSNPYGWDQVANVIYVDQPIGTGFSYFTNKNDFRTTSEEAGLDFYHFLQMFFKEHPEYAKNEFYITGESYAGHYIPAFASLIHTKNKMKQGILINLKGIAIGNGWVSPGIQTEADPDYALMMKLINWTQCKQLNATVRKCLQEVRNNCGDGTRNNHTGCVEAKDDCNVILNTIAELNPGVNYYDIRKQCYGSVCYDFSNVELFMNQASVKKELGVGSRIDSFSCSDAVYDAMAGDWMRDYEHYIPELLEDGIKLLVYAGEYDLLCNWLGNWRWVLNMKWSDQNKFFWAPNVVFKVKGNKKAGLLKSYGPLSFLKMYNAGHLVPMDQPQASLEMLTRWIKCNRL